MKKLLFLVVAVLMAGTTAYALAQERDGGRDAQIDQIFSWITPESPGCAVAASRHGDLVVNRAYGLSDLERQVSITPDTVFDVGSVVKQFVAASILLLVEDGKVALDEDVRTYIPELPDSGAKITIDHLLTHTSGVRDWTGILPLAATSTDALTITLRQRGLNFAPGDEWSYSNSGYVLLKEIVARRSGVSFADFARERLFEPLGMNLTHYQYDWREVVRNRALAYEQADGRWKADMLLDDERGGGGGLLSTAGDLVIWNDALTAGRLSAFVTEKLQEPARLNNGRVLGYGRGLMLENNGEMSILWHSGSAAAYNSVVARYPEHGMSVAILCNAGDVAEVTAFARNIFDVFVPGTRGGDAGEVPPASAPAIDYTGRAGLFFDQRSGEPLRLQAERAGLRVPGGPPLLSQDGETFRPAAPTLFFRSQDRFEMRFLSNDEFELTSMEGRVSTYRRAVPYAPTAADLASFAGRFESTEIGAVFQVEAGERSLTLRLEHAPKTALEFRPVAPGVFQAGLMTMRFHRGQRGEVTGFDYSNPVLRSIPFNRLAR